MIKIGDTVKVTGTRGMYSTYKKMADLMGSTLYKDLLYPKSMKFEVVEKQKHHRLNEMVYLLKNNEGEFLFTDKEGEIIVLSKPKPRTKTEFVKVEYSTSWQAAKDHEERVEFLYRQSDLGDAIKGNNWKAIQSPSEAAQYHFDLYRKVETEIDERQEFIDECQKYGSWEAMYDSGKFKLVEK